MNKLASDILNALLDKYETSKSFYNENKSNQTFSLVLFDKKERKDKVGQKLFAKYIQGEDGEYRGECEDIVHELEQQGFVHARWHGEVFEEITLRVDKISEIYAILGRIPKNKADAEVYQAIQRQIEESQDTPITKAFLEMLLDKMDRHQSVKQYYSGPRGGYVYLISRAIERNGKEVYLRNFSKRLTKLSKYVENRESTLMTIFNYGEQRYQTFDELLNHYHIFRVPSPIWIKGPLVIDVDGQQIDLGRIDGEFALSNAVLGKMSFVECNAKKVITIENLTPFYDYDDKDAIIIYLGGYASRVQIEFLKALHDYRPDLPFYHFGDIDWGGFQIFIHLCENTGIPFEPLFMDGNILDKYHDECISLTLNDIANLKALYEKDGHPFKATIEYMLENNIKLEQEALSGISESREEEWEEYYSSL